MVIRCIVDNKGIWSGKILCIEFLTMTVETYPEATTGTYASRWAPDKAQIYSKCAARAASEIPGRANRIV
jgi:hypothetical protein